MAGVAERLVVVVADPAAEGVRRRAGAAGGVERLHAPETRHVDQFVVLKRLQADRFAVADRDRLVDVLAHEPLHAEDQGVVERRFWFLGKAAAVKADVRHLVQALHEDERQAVHQAGGEARVRYDGDPLGLCLVVALEQLNGDVGVVAQVDGVHAGAEGRVLNGGVQVVRHGAEHHVEPLLEELGHRVFVRGVYAYAPARVPSGQPVCSVGCGLGALGAEVGHDDARPLGIARNVIYGR